VADDLAQEAWLRITQRFGQLHDSQKIEAWIYRIARNIVADYFRRHHETTVLPDELPAPPDNRAIEETQQQHYDYIRDVVGNLPEPHREALTLTI
jgi:RNA polymerase sigma-70 factor (ECF subfamily)